MRFASCLLGERRLAALVEDDSVRPLRDVVELGRDTPSEVLADPPLTDERVPLADVRLLPVVPRPGKIVCVGVNYRAHADEGGYDLPDYPALFSKFTETLVAAGEPILLPPEPDAVDFGPGDTRGSGRLYGRERCLDARLPVQDAPVAAREELGLLDAAGPVSRDAGRGRRPPRPRHLARAQRPADAVGEYERVHLRRAEARGDDLGVRPAGPRRRRPHGNAERRGIPARSEDPAAGRRSGHGRDRAGREAREPGRRGVGLSGWGSDRRRAAMTVSFDNLGEVTELQRGEWPQDQAVGRHFSVTRALPRILALLEELGLQATFFVEGLNTELYPVRESELLRRGVRSMGELDLQLVGFRPPGGRLTKASVGTLRALGFEYCSPAGSGVGVRAGVAVLPFQWEVLDAYHYLPRFGPLRGRDHGSDDVLPPNRFGETLDSALRTAV